MLTGAATVGTGISRKVMFPWPSSICAEMLPGRPDVVSSPKPIIGVIGIHFTVDVSLTDAFSIHPKVYDPTASGSTSPALVHVTPPSVVVPVGVWFQLGAEAPVLPAVVHVCA